MDSRVLAWCLLLAAAGCPLAGQTLPSNGSAPASQKGDVSASVAEIKSAGDLSAVMSAYSRGCVADRNSKALNAAYMRRLLQLGRPDVAVYPAKALQTLDPADGLAWGVTAYNSAKKGELLAALTANLKAIETASDDPSILFNLGQLVAWADCTPDAKGLTDAIKQAIEKNRPGLVAKKDFADSYGKAKAFYAQRDKLRADFDQKIAAAEKDSADVRDAADAIDKKYRDLADQIDSHQQMVRALGRDYQKFQNDDLESNRLMREQLLARMRVEQLAIDDLKKQQKQVTDDAKPLLLKLKAAVATLEQLNSQKKDALGKLQPNFLWMPPAVDGVVTPENPAGTSTGPTSRPAAAPDDLAARQIALAKMYIINDMSAKAAEILRDVIDKNPDTPAAAQAKKLLAELK